MDPSADYLTVKKIIHQRMTEKVLGDPEHPVVWSQEQLEACDRIVKQAIRDCGAAPFHFDRKRDGIAEPWRVDWLDCFSCQRMARDLPELVPDLRPGSKIRSLLAACGSLTLFTWLPNDGTDSRTSRVNREHLAATAAAVQNFLLLLTAQSLPNYWSSGTLIADHLFPELGIAEDAILAAAIFVHYPAGQGDTETVHGKQRARRSPDQAWFRETRYPGIADGTATGFRD